MREVMAAEIGHGEFAEHVVEDRRRVLDRVVALDHAGRLELCEGEGFHIFLQRHTVLKTQRDGDGEVVHHRPEGRAFLVHIDEDFAKAAVTEFAGAQIHLVPADDSLLGVALATVRQLFAVTDNTLDDALDDLFRDRDGLCGSRGCNQRLDRVVLVLFILDERGIERLGELGAVAVKGVGLQRKLPRKHVGVLAILDGRLVRHVNRLGNRARDERLGGRHHADVAFDRKVALADLAAGVGAVEDGEVLRLQERRAFQRHGTADVDVGSLDLLLREADMLQKVEGHVGELLVGNLEGFLEEVGAKRPLVEGELDVEGRLEAGADRFDLLVGKALCLQRAGVDGRRLIEVAVADGIGLDLGDLAFGIAERAQRFGNGAVDDLEVTAAGQLLELHQREVGLDAGRVAVHDEADRAGGRDNGRLGIAVAVLFTERDGLVPGSLGMNDQRLVRALIMDEGYRVDRELLVAGRFAVSRAAVVAHDAQHVFAVRLEIRERTELARHLGGGRIRDARHDGGQCTGDGAAFRRVIRNAGGHQQAADIGVAEAERAVLVGAFRDLARGELRHHDRDFQHDGPKADGVFVIGNVDVLGGRILELKQVQRGEVAGGIVEEHVFRARVRGADRARVQRGVPVVHRRVEVQARIGGRPGGVGDLLPEVTRLQRLHDLAVLAGGKVPVAIVFDGAQEVVLERDGVVGILAGDREVGFRIPVRVVGLELEVLVALLGELDDALDVVFRDLGLLGCTDLALQRRVFSRVVAAVAFGRAVDAGLHDGLQVTGDDLGAGDEGRDLLLFLDLPVDVGLDIRMVDVDHDHLGRTTRRAARLDGAGCPVADLQEAHQAGGTAAARQLFAFAAQMREVRAGARAVFEEAGFTHPQVHDAVLVDEIVLDGLDEAGMRLGMLVSRLGLGQLAGEGVDIEMALTGAVDAIGPVQAGVEPLRRVRCDALGGEHIGQFVLEGGGVFLGCEVLTLPAPVGPGAGETVEDLARIGFRAEALTLGERLQGFGVRHGAPQERRYVVFLDLLQARGHASLAEVLLGEDVGCDLAELLGHIDIGQPEDDGSIRVLDLAGGLAELDVRIGRLARFGETTFYTHCPLSSVPHPVAKQGKNIPARPQYPCSQPRSSSPYGKPDLISGIPVSCAYSGCKR